MSYRRSLSNPRTCPKPAALTLCQHAARAVLVLVQVGGLCRSPPQTIPPTVPAEYAIAANRGIVVQCGSPRPKVEPIGAMNSPPALMEATTAAALVWALKTGWRIAMLPLT